MKIKNLLIVTGILVITSCVVSKKKYSSLEEENAKLKKELADSKLNEVDMTDEEAKMSYALGVNIAASLQGQGLEKVDTAAIAKGMGDVYSDREPKMTVPAAQQTLNEHFEKVQNAKIEKQSGEGAEFLAKNSMKPGVIVLPSGLQYEILREGSGAKPNVTDKIKAHYHGTLIDGTVFDSSVERGTPLQMEISRFIKGWQIALPLMPIGSKWRLYIPHTLAYGERGSGKIPPYAAIIFEIELIDIIK